MALASERCHLRDLPVAGVGLTLYYAMTRYQLPGLHLLLLQGQA